MRPFNARADDLALGVAAGHDPLRVLLSAIGADSRVQEYLEVIDGYREYRFLPASQQSHMASDTSGPADSGTSFARGKQRVQCSKIIQASLLTGGTGELRKVLA